MSFYDNNFSNLLEGKKRCWIELTVVRLLFQTINQATIILVIPLVESKMKESREIKTSI